MAKSAAAGIIASLVAALCVANAGAQERRLDADRGDQLGDGPQPHPGGGTLRHGHRRRRGHQGASSTRTIPNSRSPQPLGATAIHRIPD